MHRVELKGQPRNQEKQGTGVPNAPCGVESEEVVESFYKAHGFLMHRVELKDKGFLLLIDTPGSS